MIGGIKKITENNTGQKFRISQHPSVVKYIAVVAGSQAGKYNKAKNPWGEELLGRRKQQKMAHKTPVNKLFPSLLHES